MKSAFCGFVLAVACTTPALSQTADTIRFSQGELGHQFFVGNGYPHMCVAVHLPADLGGLRIDHVRAYYSADTGTSQAAWDSGAKFAWSLAGADTSSMSDTVQVSLKTHPELFLGGWLDMPLNWLIPNGLNDSLWLVGHWFASAPYVRLETASAIPGVEAIVGYSDGGQMIWQSWSGEGLVVELIVSDPDQGPPSGIFDSDGRTPTDSSTPITYFATSTGDGLTVHFLDHASSDTPITFDVVNILGQSIVSWRGVAPVGSDLHIPWSDNQPSGVYLCRMSTGGMTTCVPLVILK